MKSQDMVFVMRCLAFAFIWPILAGGLLGGHLLKQTERLQTEIDTIRTEVSASVVTVAVEGMHCEADENTYKFLFHENFWEKYVARAELHMPDGNAGEIYLENSAGMREFTLSKSGIVGTLVVRLKYPKSKYGELRFVLDRSGKLPSDWHWRLKRFF